jgi:hypothetical protein
MPLGSTGYENQRTERGEVYDQQDCCKRRLARESRTLARENKTRRAFLA